MTPKFNIETNVVYYDLDGVLADFDRFVDAHMVRISDSTPLESVIEDKRMWDFLSTIDHFYRGLELTVDANKLWDYCESRNLAMKILTAIPRRSTIPHAEADKRAWVAHHFGSHVVVQIGPFSRDKWRHASPGDILIDDRKSNIDDWVEMGNGHGVLHVLGDAASTIHALGKIID